MFTETSITIYFKKLNLKQLIRDLGYDSNMQIRSLLPMAMHKSHNSKDLIADAVTVYTLASLIAVEYLEI